MSSVIKKTATNNDNVIGSFYALIVSVMPIIFAVFNGTNLGNRLRTTQVWTLILIFAAINYLFVKRPFVFPVNTKNMTNYFLLFFSAICISGVVNFSFSYPIKMGLLLSFIFTFSYLGYKVNTLKIIGYVYAVISAYLSLDFTRSGITSNWNANIIGIIILYGIFLMILTRTINGKDRLIIDWGIIIILISLLIPTKGRAAFVGVAVFMVFRFFIFKKLLYNKLLYRIYYVIVFILPIWVVNFYLALWSSPIAKTLDLTAYRYTGKYFFTGREIVWRYGFNLLKGHWLFGYGQPTTGNSHNLSMGIMFNVGIIGFIAYLLFLASIYEFLFDYLKDKIVLSCVFAFSSIYIMQSFETIMFNSKTMNVVPYLFLAIAIGRSVILNNSNQTLEVKNKKSSVANTWQR